MPPRAETIPSNDHPPEANPPCTRSLDSVTPLRESDRLPPMASAGVRPTLRHPVAFACALAASSMAAFYFFGAWWDATKIAAEVQKPERDRPRPLCSACSR